MPVVDILSIAPPSDKTDTVAFGGDEITVHPLTISQIARIAQRFAGFRKVYFATKEELAALDIDYRAASNIEAYPAIIVAGTRKDAAADAHLVERHIERFPQEDIMVAARAILRLTNGEPEAKQDAPPLTTGGDAAPHPGPAAKASPISSPPSSS